MQIASSPERCPLPFFSSFVSFPELFSGECPTSASLQAAFQMSLMFFLWTRPVSGVMMTWGVMFWPPPRRQAAMRGLLRPCIMIGGRPERRPVTGASR
jgi:hypothetical protein